MQSIIFWNEINLRKKDKGLPEAVGTNCLVYWRDRKGPHVETARWLGECFVQGNLYIHPRTGMLWCNAAYLAPLGANGKPAI